MLETPSETEVLIVGAGPTGLILALWLTKLGVKLRIVDPLTRLSMLDGDLGKRS